MQCAYVFEKQNERLNENEIVNEHENVNAMWCGCECMCSQTNMEKLVKMRSAVRDIGFHT